MQFIDANIIIRYLTGDHPEQTQACLKLFRKADTGLVTLTTSETVINEVVFVLLSKHLYNFPRPEIQKRLSTILMIRGLKVANKKIYLRALSLYSQLNIDFQDCMSIAHMNEQKLRDIYSYDRHFDRVDSVERIEP